MDVATAAEKIASSQYVWAILCILVVYIFYKMMTHRQAELKADNDKRETKIENLYESHKKEANERETKLIQHLERTTDTLQNIDKNLVDLQTKMETGFRELWAHVKPNNWDGVDRRDEPDTKRR